MKLFLCWLHTQSNFWSCKILQRRGSHCQKLQGIEAETLPLPRKLSGRAVKIWACISLLYYASQERKPTFSKTQGFFFLSPQCESHSVSVNYQQGWAVLCVWCLLCLPRVVNISFTETWKKQGQGGRSESSSCLLRDVTEHLWSQLWCAAVPQAGHSCSTACPPLQPQSLLYPKPVVLNGWTSLNAQRCTRARPDPVH